MGAANEAQGGGKIEEKQDESEGLLPGEELTAVVENIDFLLKGIGGMELRKK